MPILRNDVYTLTVASYGKTENKNRPESKCEDKSGSSVHDDLIPKATPLPL